MSLAGIAAVSWLLLTKAVVRFEPFHFTIEPETNFLPLTVSVKAGPPALALLGDIETIEGRELVVPTRMIFAIEGTPSPLRMNSR
jgi:hypothetical protein